MSTSQDRHLVRATEPADDSATTVITDVTPHSAGWAYSGLRVVQLPPGQSITWHLAGEEAALLPLRGGAHLEVVHDGERTEIDLTGRRDVFSGPTDFAYLPTGSEVTVSAPAAAAAPSRVALTTAVSGPGAGAGAGAPRPRAVPAAEVRIDLRGAGQCSRRVQNYTIDTGVATHRLLVCEVITPGGNWSSYPPHKHDEHTAEERELEEIYYFEVADGPQGPGGERRPGVAYHRTYGTPDRPIDVLAEVRTGDVALVPHGYHGPCTAPPGHDLYYLNVMAGPAEDGRWLATDDPAFGWIRETWSGQQVDPRITGTASAEVTRPQPRGPQSATPQTTEEHR